MTHISHPGFLCLLMDQCNVFLLDNQTSVMSQRGKLLQAKRSEVTIFNLLLSTDKGVVPDSLPYVKMKPLYEETKAVIIQPAGSDD